VERGPIVGIVDSHRDGIQRVKRRSVAKKLHQAGEKAHCDVCRAELTVLDVPTSGEAAMLLSEFAVGPISGIWGEADASNRSGITPLSCRADPSPVERSQRARQVG